MTEMKDPVRLSLGGSPAAQDLLRSANSDLPSPVQLDHLAGKLAPIVMAKGAASSVATWIIVGLVVVGAATGAFFFTRDAEPQIVTSAPTAPVVPTPPVVPPSPAPSAPVVVEEPPPPPEPVRVQPKKRVAAQPVIVEETLPPREIDLLDPAHQALRANDPARALTLANRHAELYPRGVMSEEREAIAIEALHRLGRDAARIRFGEFVVRFPRSGYRARLERLVTETKR
ncbi:MAG: hypothetical protein M4D80_15700 [Myxococcota bacterium]|nr:hypothetical protein [Deltaproteobacteria bacterium]MDQ3336611.1 hypothetical protein [Myxococcota bacterium]